MNAIERLEQSGFTVPQIARELGVTRQAVGMWKRGTVPRGENFTALVRLAETRGLRLLAEDFRPRTQAA